MTWKEWLPIVTASIAIITFLAKIVKWLYSKQKDASATWFWSMIFIFSVPFELAWFIVEYVFKFLGGILLLPRFLDLSDVSSINEVPCNGFGSTRDYGWKNPDGPNAPLPSFEVDESAEDLNRTGRVLRPSTPPAF